MQQLRILHISDLHAGKPGPESLWRQRRVLGDAWLRNVEAIAGSGRPVDLVCFTGDVAFSAQPEQYAQAAEFVRDLLGRLGLGPDRFFPVPGNHDVDRGVAEKAWKKLREALEPGDAERLSAWLAGGKPPRGIVSTAREQMLERSAAYRRWLADLGCAGLLPEQSPHGRLGYRRTIAPAGWPFPLHVVGLDTAWLCGDDHDAGKLWLTDGQIARLAADEQGRALPGFRLALAHHPLAELLDGNEARRRLAEHVDLVLRGHQHEAEPSAWGDPERTLLELAAGCLYESDRWPNFCQVIDLTLDDRGRPAACELWFRSWSPRGHWFDDNGLYRDSVAGRLRLDLARGGTSLTRRVTIAVGGHDTGTVPEPAQTQRVAEVFVGREAELEELAAALLPGAGGVRPVAICAVQGMAGIGKSYLAERFWHLHGERFPGGIIRLILPRGGQRTAEQLRDELLDRLRLPLGGDAWLRLAETLGAGTLLVLVENVDSRELGQAVAGLAARASGCPLLVTGRYAELGSAAGWARVPLPTLPPDDARSQLVQELGPEAGRYSTAQLQRLVQDLGRLPLAIHLAAGWLRAGYTPEQFRDKLQHTHLGLEFRDPAERSPVLAAVSPCRRKPSSGGWARWPHGTARKRTPRPAGWTACIGWPMRRCRALGPAWVQPWRAWNPPNCRTCAWRRPRCR